MTISRCLIICSFVMLSGSVYSQRNETYLCVADKATGFAYNKKMNTWDHSIFNVQDSRYKLFEADGRWNWSESGSDHLATCGDFDEHGHVKCNYGQEDIIFNKHNLRYILYYRAGYVDQEIAGTKSEIEGVDEPSIEIGWCSKL